jgi:predicted molibdopterin-dependent oxidoreductase YjgC
VSGARPSFRFEGADVPFQPGQTIGAALWAHGVRSWRTTRFEGRPRGLYCGIGICFDCLVDVDGRRDERACVTPARPGADVRSAGSAP